MFSRFGESCIIKEADCCSAMRRMFCPFITDLRCRYSVSESKTGMNIRRLSEENSVLFKLHKFHREIFGFFVDYR